MAWIESHTVLGRHRKVLLLAHDLGIEPVHVVGHLMENKVTRCHGCDSANAEKWHKASA